MKRNALTKVKWFIVGAFSVLAILATGVFASASGTGTFEVGGYWQPPVFVGGDYNTATNWQNIANNKIDVITGTRIEAGAYTKAANETGIANSSAKNVKLLVTDSGITGIPVYTAAEKTNLQNLLTPYKNDARVKGINIKDEPVGSELEGYANVYKTAKALAPNLDYYLNLLPASAPTGLIATPHGKLAVSNSEARGSSSYVTSTNSLGQTITIPADMSFLDGVDFNIDASQWTTGETLSLRLWNSPAKTSLISLAINQPSTGSYFQFDKAVTPGGTYYLELTHSGGGNNSVGMARSNGGVSTYSGGQAYEAGVAQNYDFSFRLYAKRTHMGTNYTFENYVDDWVQYSGSDLILYDEYPFLDTTDNSAYFLSAEIARARGLANDVKYGAFLQGINNAGRTMTEDMMRWNVYTLLPYGMKRMDWFYYWNPFGSPGPCSCAVEWNGTVLNPRYTQLQTLNTEMRNLGGTLKNLTSTNVYHTGNSLWQGTTMVPGSFWIKPTDLAQPMIIGTFTNASNRQYVMLSLRDYVSSRTVTFNFNPKPASLTEISKSTGLEVAVPGYNAATGNVTITFAKGEGKLFALPVGYTPSPNLAIGASVDSASSVDNGDWGANKVNDGQRNTVSGSSGWTSSIMLSTNHTESVTLDMINSRSINKVDLYPRNDGANTGLGFPINFTIQVANNAAGPWTTVITRTGYGLPGNAVQSFPFTAVSARYVKVEGTSLRQITTEGGAPYRMQLAEIEIYGGPGISMPVANSGFETPSSANFQYGPFTNGWTFTANAGVQRNGGSFGAYTAPEGVQTALLQRTGEMSQVINFTAGTYSVNFQAAKRGTDSGSQLFNVYYDATLIGTFSPSSTLFTTFNTNSFVATAGNHTIKFAGTGVTDVTDFVDDVRVTQN